MDTTEAKALLASELRKYRPRSYHELRERIGSQDDFVAPAPSGKNYAIEVDFFWDGRPDGDVRVMAMIDDGGLRAMFPLTDSFIVRPTGEFVGEEAG